MDSEQVAEIAGCIDTSSTFLALVEMQVGADGWGWSAGGVMENVHINAVLAACDLVQAEDR
jgi:hypothetical protein